MHHHTARAENFLENIVAVLAPYELGQLRKQVRLIHMEHKLMNLYHRNRRHTRGHKSIYLGASPRASIGILNGSKALAAMRGRDFVTPEDIIYIARPY